jgi:hypothetical protein
MIILQGQSGQTYTLESYQLERQAPGQPVKIRVHLLLSTPGFDPEEMRLQIEYEVADLPRYSETEFGHRLLGILRNRFG